MRMSRYRQASGCHIGDNHEDVTMISTERMVIIKYLEHRVTSAALTVGVGGVLGPVAVTWVGGVGED